MSVARNQTVAGADQRVRPFSTSRRFGLLGTTALVGIALTANQSWGQTLQYTVTGTDTAPIVLSSPDPANNPTRIEVGDGVTATLSGAISENPAPQPLLFGLIAGATSGTVVLTNAASYTGGTTIEGATLSIGGGGTTGSILGPIALQNGGRLQFDRSDNYVSTSNVTGNGSVRVLLSATLNGAITSTGSLYKDDAGTFTFGGVRSGGTSSGIDVSGASASLTVASPGSVLGGDFLGVRIGGANATLTNLGGITNTGINGDGGVGTGVGIFANSGTTQITNGSPVNATALIRGRNTAVNHINGSAGALTVNNYGSLLGEFYNGIENQTGAGAVTVNNFAGGVINGRGDSGIGAGIASDTQQLTIVNGGMILGHTYGISANAAAAITNSGTIQGTDQSAIYATAGGVTIDNSGTLTTAMGDTPANSLARNAIFVSGNTGGITTITNRAGGVINGNNYGITISSTDGTSTLTNEATAQIIGGYRGVYFGNIATAHNFGAITATVDNGISLFKGGTLTNHTGGTITADGVNAWGVYAKNAAAAIDNQGIVHANSGVVTNFSGTTVANSGTITAITNGVWALSGTTGSLANTGTITGAVGVQFDSGGTIGNQSGGHITGTNAGVSASGTTAITNEIGGTIAGGDTGIYTNSDATIVNRGTISGGTYAVNLDAGGTLVNDGALNAAPGSAAIRFAAASTITLNNGSSVTGDIRSAVTSGTNTVTIGGSVTGGYTASAPGGAIDNLTLRATAAIGGVALGDGNDRLTYFIGAATGAIDGGAGSDSFVIDGTGTGILGAGITGFESLTKNGAGIVTLSGTNTASLVTINAGTLNANGGGAIDNSASVTVASGASFGLLASETIGSLAGAGNVSLGASTLTLGGNNGGTTFAGVASGTGGLTKVGGGTLTISGANSYTGTTSVREGTLRFGANDVLSDGTFLEVLNGATLDLNGFSDTVGGFALLGTLTGSGTLTANTYNLYGGTVDQALGAGTVNQVSGVTLVNATINAGNINVTGGTLQLGSADRFADSATVSVNTGGTLDLQSRSDTVARVAIAGTLAGSGTLTAVSYNLQGGTVTANLGSGALTQSSGVSTLAGTSGANNILVDGGTLRLGASNRLDDTANLVVHATGTLNLQGFNETVGNAVVGGTLNGTGTLNADQIVLENGAINANLRAGYLSAGAANTLSTLNGAAAAGLIEVTGGTLAVGGSNLLADNAGLYVDAGTTFALGNNSDTIDYLQLEGTLDGTGTLTATSRYDLLGGTVNANLGAGTLAVGSQSSTNASPSTLNGTSGAAAITVRGGATLALGGSNRLADVAAVTVNAGGILDLGANSDTVGSIALVGKLNGSGTLTAATYDLNGAVVNANLGAGILAQISGTSMLNGASAAALVNLAGGTLALGASNRLSDTAALGIGTGATLDLAAFDDMIGTASIAGTLTGTGTLTAATYTLNGGVVNANLGAGALTQATGNSMLTGAAGATTVRIIGGSLLLGAAERLADGAALTIDASGALDLGGVRETVGSASIAGTLSGTGTLTAGTYSLNGGTVNANLGSGALTQAGGISTLTGRTSAATIAVDAGKLTLGASDRMSDTAALSVAAGATLDLATFNDTVGSATLAGTLAGAGTLTTALYALNGASVNANLGAGTITSTGATALNGTAAANAVAIDSGIFTLGAANRLVDTAAVTVAGGATLNLSGFNDTVGTVTVAGALAGTGTLSATTYALNGASLNANLGGGVLNQASGVSLLTGTSAAGTVAINGGTLRLGANERLADTAAVTIADGAIFDLAGKTETVAALSGKGTVALGAGRLILGGGNADFAYQGTISGSGDIDKVGTGQFTLAGSQAGTSRFNLISGTTLFAGPTAAAVRIQGGALIGTAAIGGGLQLASGTLAPGTTAQPLGAMSAASFAVSGGNFAVSFGGQANGFASSLLDIAGAATLAGGTVTTAAIEPAAGYGKSQTYTILQAQSLSGTFANGSSFARVDTNGTGLYWRLRYDLAPNSVILEVRKMFDFTADLGSSPSRNIRAIGAALNDAAPSGTDKLVALLDIVGQQNPDQRRATYNSLSGEAIGSLTSTINAVSGRFTDLLRHRLVAGGHSGGDVSLVASLLDKPGALESVRAATPIDSGSASSFAGPGGEKRGGAWIQAVAANGRLDGESGEAGVTNVYSGVTAGLDGRIGAITIGAAVSTIRVESQVQARTSSSEGTLHQGGGYIAYDDGGTYANVIGSYFQGDIDTRRSIYVGGVLAGRATGTADTSGYAVGGAVGHRFAIGGATSFAVQASGGATQVTRKAFTETGAGGLSLGAARERRDLYNATFEGRISNVIRAGGGTIEPYAGGGVRFDLGDLDTLSTNRFSGAPAGTGSFVVQGARLSPTSGVLSGGVQIRPASDVTFDIGVESTIAKRAREGRITASMRIRF